MSGPKPRRKPPGRGGGGRTRRPPGGAGRGRSNPTTSPLQLPHVKVTIRNISGDKNTSIVGVVDSVKAFLDGAFGLNSSQTGEGSAYMLAWQKEKDDFEKNKSLLESAAANSNSASLGYAYEEKVAAPCVDELPSPEAIANAAQRAALDDNKLNSIHSTIDSAMTQMMNECGKVYLNHVGGRVVFDEESALVVTLAERIESEKKKMEEKNEKQEAELGVEAEDKPVEQITKDMEKLSTDAKPANDTTASPSTRIRILSATPVKKSKRRGDIGARVELVLYPPDPCLIFKEACREAGRIAAEGYADRKKAEAEKNQALDATSEETTQPTANPTIPPIPNFPRLSPAERSRALARSKILMDRLISAMKIHAKSSDFSSWEIFESSSQKTWKGQSNDLVSALLSGASLGDLLESNDDTKLTRRSNARGDRYDSTLENSEDYKSFLSNNDAAPTPPSEKSVKQEKLDEEGRPISALVQHLQSKRDEEKRAKAEAAAAASRARAKAAQEAAREKARKKELEAKTRKAKARMKREEERRKNGGKVGSRPGSASGRPGSAGSGGSVPPPGAVLLKKGGGKSSGSIPASGFNS